MTTAIYFVIGVALVFGVWLFLFALLKMGGDE